MYAVDAATSIFSIGFEAFKPNKDEMKLAASTLLQELVIAAANGGYHTKNLNAGSVQICLPTHTPDKPVVILSLSSDGTQLEMSDSNNLPIPLSITYDAIAKKYAGEDRRDAIVVVAEQIVNLTKVT